MMNIKKNIKYSKITTKLQGQHTKNRFYFYFIGCLKYIILIIVSILFLFPVYWIVTTSLKIESKLYTWPLQWFPNPMTLHSYSEAVRQLPLGRMALNSVIIAVITIVSNIIICSFAGYVFARKPFPGRNIIFVLVIVTMMLPIYTRLIPLYILTLQLGLQNTYLGIVLPSAITAFGIFLMRQYFISLPADLEDAARVDGCSEMGVIFRIVLPLSRPAIASLAMFALVWSTQDFLWPLIVTASQEMRPLPVGITLFIDVAQFQWGPIMAMTTITALPMIIIFFFIQSQFIRGLTAGAVKG